MAIYTSEAYQRLQPEALPHTGDLRLFPEVEDYDMQPIATQTGREAWGIRIADAEGSEKVTRAEAGTLIREADSNRKSVGHTFINADGERMRIDPDQDTYPIEVAARLERVNKFREEQGLPPEDPLGLRWPEALRPDTSTPVAAQPQTYEGRHAAEPRYKAWFKKLGKKIGGFLVQPMLTEEAPDMHQGEPALVATQTAPEQQPKAAAARPVDTAPGNSPRTPSPDIARAFGYRRASEAPLPAESTPTTAEEPFQVAPEAVEITPYHEPDLSLGEGAVSTLINEALERFDTNLEKAVTNRDFTALTAAYNSVKKELSAEAQHGSANAPVLLARLDDFAEQLRPLAGDRHIGDLPMVINAPQ